jgi:hypothetical protein
MAKKAQPDVDLKILMLAYLCIKDANSLPKGSRKNNFISENAALVNHHFEQPDDLCLRLPAITGRTCAATRRSRIAKRAEGLVLDGRKSGAMVCVGRQAPIPMLGNL